MVSNRRYGSLLIGPDTRGQSSNRVQVVRHGGIIPMPRNGVDIGVNLGRRYLRTRRRGVIL